MTQGIKFGTRALGWVAVTGALVAAPLALSTGTANAATHNWDGVAQCESGGDWGINTGNGYYGGLQFTQSTWSSNGGSGSPANASKAEQVRVAENVLQTQGAGAWPVCGQRLSSGTTQTERPSAAAVAPAAPAVPAPPATPQFSAAADALIAQGTALAEQYGVGPQFQQLVAVNAPQIAQFIK